MNEDHTSQKAKGQQNTHQLETDSKFWFLQATTWFQGWEALDIFRQDQIHWSQEPTYPRSILWSQTLPQSKLDSLVIGTYISKINIVVADIISVKIRFIGHRILRIQDQYRGRRHYLSQDQIRWSQEPTYPTSISWLHTSPQSRSDSLVAGTYVSKINIVVADITSVKIRFIGHRNLRIQDQYHDRKHYLSQD